MDLPNPADYLPSIKYSPSTPAYSMNTSSGNKRFPECILPKDHAIPGPAVQRVPTAEAEVRAGLRVGTHECCH